MATTYYQTELTQSTPCTTEEPRHTDTNFFGSKPEERHALAGLDNPFWKSEEKTA